MTERSSECRDADCEQFREWLSGEKADADKRARKAEAEVERLRAELDRLEADRDRIRDERDLRARRVAELEALTCDPAALMERALDLRAYLRAEQYERENDWLADGGM